MDAGTPVQATTEKIVGDTRYPERTKTQIINDPVHGSIEVNAICMKIIDTPQFQRLRQIKQLGGCYYVYPGSTHSRFEHSIGVYHLAGEFARYLQKYTTGPPEILITDKDILCVEVAGLCHDLGHGPYSHVFERLFMQKLVNKEWKHDTTSVKMFEFLLEQNEDVKLGLEERLQADDSGLDYLELIKELINPPKFDGKNYTCGQLKGKPKEFLYEIVSNSRNDIDVDRFDYMARDSYMCGLKNNFDHIRYMKLARVCFVPDLSDDQTKWQICMKEKEAMNLYDMFTTRVGLYRRAYFHVTTRGVELMIADALYLVDEHLSELGISSGRKKLSDSLDDMNIFMQLRDNLCDLILFSKSEELKVKAAQRILKLLQERKIYKCIAQATQKKGDTEPVKEKHAMTIKEEIVRQEEGEAINGDDFHVLITVFNHSKANTDPMKNVRYYRKQDPQKAIPVLKQEVSHMLPVELEERVVSIYSKLTDSKTCQTILGKFKKRVDDQGLHFKFENLKEFI